MRQSVGSSANGSIQKRPASGMSSMSDSCMEAQPRIEEASKPKPSSKEPSSSSCMGNVRCCQDPTRSVKRTETNFASWSSAYFKTEEDHEAKFVSVRFTDLVGSWRSEEHTSELQSPMYL